MLFRFVTIMNNQGQPFLLDALTRKVYLANGEPVKCNQCFATAVIDNKGMFACPKPHTKEFAN